MAKYRKYLNLKQVLFLVFCNFYLFLVAEFNFCAFNLTSGCSVTALLELKKITFAIIF